MDDAGVPAAERGRPPLPRSPVLADVAAAAGVSHQTVSRVVNAHPSVAAPTRERVERAIAALGYRPNSAARALVTRRSGRIGVVATGSSHFGPAATLLGIEEAARRAGYAVSVTILTSLDRAGMREALEHLHREAVDGIVVIAPQDASREALAAVDAAVPLVAVEADPADPADAAAPAPEGPLDQVRGARLATEHLLGLGHATVHHVSGPLDWREARSRALGWRAALEAAGAAVPAPEPGDWTAASGHRAGLRLLERRSERVSAVFAGNDQMALGLVRALAERGRAVPGEISVVGYDDLPESAYFTPPLTTVRRDFPQVGRRALEDLLARMSGRPPRAHAAALPQLLVRASTAPPP